MCCCLGKKDPIDQNNCTNQQWVAKAKGEGESYLSGAKTYNHNLIIDSKTHRTALRLFKKATDMGHIAAEYELAKMCINLGSRLNVLMN